MRLIEPACHRRFFWSLLVPLRFFYKHPVNSKKYTSNTQGTKLNATN